MNNKNKNIVGLIIVSISLVVVIILFITTYNPNWKSSFISETALPTPTVSVTEPLPIIQEQVSPTIEENTTEEVIPDDGLPHDKLFITVARQHYESGDLTLIIPKLEFEEQIENGTDKTSLNNGPGLYEYSQLPGEGDCNVSIAAHRNTSRNGVIGVWFFYYIDTLTTGDYLYLVDAENIYRYIYDQTTVVDPYDWGPIYSHGFSCLTLTSCEPIGISTERIIVRSKLDEIIPYSKDFVYESALTVTE